MGSNKHRLEERECPECGKFTFIANNRSTCCLQSGQKRSRPDEFRLSQRDLDKLLTEAVERGRQMVKEELSEDVGRGCSDGATVLITDPHIPLHHVAGWNAMSNMLVALKGTGYIKRLVLGGDVFDGTNLSRYPKENRGEGHPHDIGDEIYAGRHMISDLVDCVEESSWYFIGNHEHRLNRLIAAQPGLPAEILSFDNMLAYYDYPERLAIHKERKLTIGRGDGKVTFIHGEKYNKHRAAGLLEENLYENTVQGHTHRPQTYWYKGRFGLVNGYLHDPKRQGYDPDPTWTLGFTIFEHWDNGRHVNPYFVRITDNGSFSFMGKVWKA